jgi:L-ribulose-5-phosphate 3-epimerase
MYSNPIGVIVDSFKAGLQQGIKKAKEVGAEGIQLYAVSGAMAPENLNENQIREILAYIQSNDLVVSAVCGDLGGHGFAVREQNKEKIERSKRIMDLARELETNIVTTHVGVVPEDKNHPRYRILQEACEEIGKYGDKIGVYFAIETGPEKAETLKDFLDSLNCNSVKVNYDPANLVMVTGDDPVKGVYLLKDYIVHTHAKDGIMVKKTNPEVIYNFFAEGGIEDLRLEDYFKEVPLGEGQVNFNDYIMALNDIGYNGFLTIEREVGENPEEDIRKAVNFLRCLR